MIAELGDPAITAMVRHHHERLDGSGYPDGLSGDAIPLGSRIISVADTFDAITSSRTYHGARAHRRALEVVSEEAGTGLTRTWSRRSSRYYSGARSVAWSAFGFTGTPRLATWLGGSLNGAGGWVSPLVQSFAAIAAAALASVAVEGPAPQASAASSHGPPAMAGEQSRPNNGAGQRGGTPADRSPGAQVTPVSDRPADRLRPDASVDPAPGGSAPVNPSPGNDPSPLPDVETPPVQLPDVRVPDVRVPDVRVPDVALPQVTLPRVEVPRVELPRSYRWCRTRRLTVTVADTVVRRALVLAILALTIACPIAFAQLPQLPQLPHVQTPKAVEDVANAPLPDPVEDVANDSPLGPIRDQVRDVVRETGATGGGSTGGGTSGGGNSSPGTGSSVASPTGTSAPPSSTTDRSRSGLSSPGKTSGKAKRRAASRNGAAGQSPAARGVGGAAGAREARAKRDGRKTASEGTRNPVVRSIEKIVEVVPTALWLALGALLALALAVSARAFVERRRAREADRDRRRLMRDVAVLERALVPAVPEVLGALAISVAHRASEGPAVGGDFYDAFELSGGRVALLVGDVSGHGPDALERTNTLRTALRACLEAGLAPRAALEAVSRRSGIEPSGRFATVVVAIHDPADGTLTYAMAGHPPPIFAGPGAHEPLTSASSPPMGAGLRTGLRETTVPLASGTVACFFTDGLLEARMSGDFMGREELARFVAELGPEQFAESLLAQVIAVADSTPDDMVVCVVRPVSGAEILAPRLETLELDGEDITLGLADRFLEACDVPAYQAATAVDALSSTAASCGTAVLEVTIDGAGPRVRVTRPEAAPGTEALAASARACPADRRCECGQHCRGRDLRVALLAIPASFTRSSHTRNDRSSHTTAAASAVVQLR